MADKENDEEAEAAAAAAKKKKMIGGVVAAGLIYRFVLSGGAEEPAPEALAAVAEEAVIEEGEILAIPEMTLNLADTDELHFARIGLAVVLQAEVDPVIAGTKLPIVQDVVVQTVGDMTFDELRAPGAKEALKELLSEQSREAFNGETVSRIVFTSFVMQ
jgi:flagellar basal body-associated protein FliL